MGAEGWGAPATAATAAVSAVLISPLTPAQLQRPSVVCLHCLVSSSVLSINCVHCIDQLGTAVKCVPSNRTQTLHYITGGAGRALL